MLFRSVQLQTNHAHIMTREGLKVVRSHLSRKLYELQATLSRPGHGGEWSSFLQSSGSPRSTANRLVCGHEEALTPVRGNRIAESIDEATTVAIQGQLKALWPRLSQVLRTAPSVELFIAELRRTAERSLAMDVNAASLAPPAPGYEPPVSAGHHEGAPLSSATMAGTLQPAEIGRASCRERV